jgi:pimeloyl-ACP methyl ester carboxylesterase
MMTLQRFLLLFAGLCLLISCLESHDLFVADDAGKLMSTTVQKRTPSGGLDQDRFVMMKDIDLKVHYRIIGEGPIDMVFIPGWTNPLTVYTKQFDYFRDKARCIYIDLPGTGLSDAPTPNTPASPIPDGFEYTMELMAEAVYTVIEKEGLHKFVGVGFSMGPIVLGMFERNYPGMISILVAIDGDFNPWPKEEPERSEFIALREETYLDMLAWDTSIKEAMGETTIPPTLEGPNAEELKEWGSYFPRFPSDILANTYYHVQAENANEPLGWIYPKLCLYGNPNPYMDNVIRIYPNNTVYSFLGGGHVIQWMFHEEINPIIWNFIIERHGRK